VKGIEESNAQPKPVEVTENKFDEWFCCDGCYKPIKPGKTKFDCKTCENFTFCSSCFKSNEKHLHEFEKGRVAFSNAPPSNSKELMSKAFVLCQYCKTNLTGNFRQTYKCTDKEVYVCKTCKPEHKDDHTLVRVKKDADLFIPQNDSADDGEDLPETLKQKVEEYENIGYEDVIGKDLKTRFKYRSVPKFDFGLSNADILLLDDYKLNRLVSLKKYRTYRDDEQLTNLHRVKTVKSKMNEELEKTKGRVKREMKMQMKLQKDKLLEDGKDKDRLIKEAEKERRKNKYLGKRTAEEAEIDQQESSDSEQVNTKTKISRRRKNLY